MQPDIGIDIRQYKPHEEQATTESLFIRFSRSAKRQHRRDYGCALDVLVSQSGTTAGPWRARLPSEDINPNFLYEIRQAGKNGEQYYPDIYNLSSSKKHVDAWLAVATKGDKSPTSYTVTNLLVKNALVGEMSNRADAKYKKIAGKDSQPYKRLSVTIKENVNDKGQPYENMRLKEDGTRGMPVKQGYFYLYSYGALTGTEEAHAGPSREGALAPSSEGAAHAGPTTGPHPTGADQHLDTPVLSVNRPVISFFIVLTRTRNSYTGKDLRGVRCLQGGCEDFTGRESDSFRRRMAHGSRTISDQGRICKAS